MARRKKTGIPGVSFSWKRALGVTSAKRKIAKFTGIPTTKQGRQAKVGRIVTGGGCVIYLICFLVLVGLCVSLAACGGINIA